MRANSLFSPVTPYSIPKFKQDDFRETRASFGEQACNSTADVPVPIRPQSLDPCGRIDKAECHYCAALVPSSSLRSMKSLNVPSIEVSSPIRLLWLYSTIAMMTASRLVEADVRFIRSFSSSSGISIVVFIHMKLAKRDSAVNPFGSLLMQYCPSTNKE